MKKTLLLSFFSLLVTYGFSNNFPEEASDMITGSDYLFVGVDFTEGPYPEIVSDGDIGGDFLPTGTGSGQGGNKFYTYGCDDNAKFYDRPGVRQPYLNFSDYYTTICPTSPFQTAVITFERFELGDNDVLYVYDEKRTDAVDDDSTPSEDDLVGTFTGKKLPKELVSKKGCFTFRFVSNFEYSPNTAAGWCIALGCEIDQDACDRFKSLVDSEIKCGEKVKDDNIRGKSNYGDYGSCSMPGWPANGREIIYEYEHKKQGDLKITLKEHADNQPKRLNMYVLNDCSPDACVGGLNRPALNGQQDKDFVLIEDAAPGTYYIVVDGNTTYAHNWFELKVECEKGLAACENAMYFDDFEAMHGDDSPDYTIDYHVGDNISKVNPWWYMNDGIGLRDAKISDKRASGDSKQSLEFNRLAEGAQDVYLGLGNHYQGAYRISWDMYIERYGTAFFGLFGGDNSDPWGTVSKRFRRNSGFEGKWFTVELYVDLDENKYAVVLDHGKEVHEGDYYLNLEKLNFYGLPGAHFYVDNLCYMPVAGIPDVSSSRLAIADNSPLLAQDNQLTLADKVVSVATDENQPELGLTTNRLNADDLKVIPNPTRGLTMIALDMAQAQNVNLQVFSPAGQLVQAISLGETQSIRQEIDLGNLPNGLYIVKVAGEQSVITKKIILQQ